MTAQEYIVTRIVRQDRGHVSPCWIWQGWLTEKGYGRASVPGFGRNHRVHRATYEICRGPIPPGLQIDHLCRVPACCNPRRAVPFRRREPRKFCPEGHAIAVTAAGRRYCRTCHNRYVREKRRQPAMAT
jgi:hypothetical protein